MRFQTRIKNWETDVIEARKRWVECIENGVRSENFIIDPNILEKWPKSKSTHSYPLDGTINLPEA